MTEKPLELQAALAHIDERWDDARTRRGLERAKRSLRRRSQRRRAAAGFGALAAVAMLVWVSDRRSDEARAELAALPSTSTGADRSPLPAAARDASSASVRGPMPLSEAEPLLLADGSRIVPRGAGSRVVVIEDSARSVRLELVSGRARFEVVPRAERVFRVQSGEVSVEVLGTIFDVTRADGGVTQVVVERGRVRVSWPGDQRELSAAEQGSFPPAPDGRALAPSAAQAHGQHGRALDRRGHTPGVDQQALGGDAGLRPGDPPPVDHMSSRPAAASGRRRSADAAERHARSAPGMTERDAARARPAAGGGWRERVARGDYVGGYAQLREAGTVPSNVEELLLAADAARLSGHAEAALPHLRRVVDAHASDSRAALAAFTLGTVLMQQLGRPREAGAAYARARALALHASLAQDALARQVEAAHRAGEPAQARELAAEYLARYPQGRRTDDVRRFAGLPSQ